MNMTERPTSTIDRRRILRTGGLAAGAAALLAAPTVARAVEPETEELVFDVALDGRTMRVVRGPQSDPNSPAEVGDTFVMYGNIFPAGTFDQGSTSPDQPGAIGRWICSGAFNVDIASGGVPHVISTVQHILDSGLSIAEGAVEEAPDAIVHVGLEGGVPVTHRAIIGGYGRFANVRGEGLQELRGENDTLIQVTPDVTVPASSYTFTFRLAR
ncbi:MAG: hypothetical protein ACRDJH_23670 [Thermomicrobiales bacterium]